MKRYLSIVIIVIFTACLCPRSCFASNEIDKGKRADADRFLCEGASSYRNKEYAAAIDAYKKAILVDPMDSRAYLGLSQTYNAQRRYKSATLNALNALKINPGDKYARSFLYTISFDQQMYEAFSYASEKGAITSYILFALIVLMFLYILYFCIYSLVNLPNKPNTTQYITFQPRTIFFICIAPFIISATLRYLCYKIISIYNASFYLKYSYFLNSYITFAVWIFLYGAILFSLQRKKKVLFLCSIAQRHCLEHFWKKIFYGVYGGILALNVRFIILVIPLIFFSVSIKSNVVIRNMDGIVSCQSLLFFLLVMFIAPFLEELLFRGIAYTNLKEKYGARNALLMSSMLFAVVHLFGGMKMSGLFMHMVTGIIYGTIYERTKSILVPTIAHIMYNAPAVLMLTFN